MTQVEALTASCMRGQDWRLTLRIQHHQFPASCTAVKQHSVPNMQTVGLCNSPGANTQLKHPGATAACDLSVCCRPCYNLCTAAALAQGAAVQQHQPPVGMQAIQQHPGLLQHAMHTGGFNQWAVTCCSCHCSNQPSPLCPLDDMRHAHQHVGDDMPLALFACVAPGMPGAGGLSLAPHLDAGDAGLVQPLSCVQVQCVGTCTS